MTRIVIVVVALPPVLLAVTVYDVEDETAVGVPEISPVEVEKERPAGTDGEIDQEVTGPPLVVGVTVVMAVPFVSVNELGLYASEEGASSMTSIVKTTLSLPPVLLPVTV